MAKRVTLRQLDPETRDEVAAYLRSVRAPRRIELDLIPAQAKGDLEYWLRRKTQIEGAPRAREVRAIGRSQKIRRPIIIDTATEFTVEGRHRLAAALKYGLDVPVVILS